MLLQIECLPKITPHISIIPDSDEIDRAFEDLINQELSLVKKGYTDGIDAGITKHCQEGYKLGLQKGSEIGSKVGSYRGFALVAIKLLNEEAKQAPLSAKKQKCLKVLGKLLKSTEEIPSTNPHAPISGLFSIFNLLNGHENYVLPHV